MKKITRRASLILGAGAFSPLLFGADDKAQKRSLPLETIFKGEDKFAEFVSKAIKEEWSKVPIGQRVIRFAKELHGTPYENFTLEIDDHIESPSVNLNGVDCWTFFETCLGMARMIATPKDTYTPEDLLREIEFTRYRGGTCTGNYLERIHYLAEWFFENDARGVCTYIVKDLGYAEKIEGRKISEMTILWKSYRYLRENPDLRDPMKKWEDYVARLPVYYVPKAKVAAIEPKLQDGDVIGIATKYNGGFCSHVGLAHRTDDGVMRFMHASRDYRKVVIDKSVSGYLDQFDKHIGILVGRPLEVDQTVQNREEYEKNLKELIG